MLYGERTREPRNGKSYLQPGFSIGFHENLALRSEQGAVEGKSELLVDETIVKLWSAVRTPALMEGTSELLGFRSV